MIRHAFAAGILSAVAGGAALAQGTVPGIPDVPAGSATLHGRVIHAERPDAVSGVPVVLYAISPSSPPGLRGSSADTDGRFTFDRISNDSSIAYLVGARYAEVPFGERVSFVPGEASREVRIEISEPIPDATAITGGEMRIRIDTGCAGVRITESHELRNPGDRVVFVPSSERSAQSAILSTAIPSDAGAFSAAVIGLSEGVVRDGDAVRFFGPLYPGSQTIEFAYDVAATSGRVVLDRVVQPGVDGVVVMTPADAPGASGEDFGPAHTLSVEGRTYSARATGAIVAGERFAVEVDVPGGDAGNVELTEVRIWLELDTAALVVDEEYVVQVPGDEPVVASGAGPVLCVPLPSDAEGLRMSPTALELGPTPDPSGGLALRGPIPPGKTSIALRYRLPVDGDSALFERRVSRPLPLLSIFVADNGVLLESDRLHGRRPVRTADRLYMQLEGFQIEPDELVSVRLTRLAPPASRRATAAGLLLAMGAVAVGFLISPLRSGIGRSEDADVAESPAAAELEAAYASIRDLDDDFETGKISPDDHARMRAELRARAVALLAAERAARVPDSRPEARSASPELAVRFCPGCSARVEPAWRFCAACGETVPVKAAGSPG